MKKHAGRRVFVLVHISGFWLSPRLPRAVKRTEEISFVARTLVARTAGLLVANEALYQLSHIPLNIAYYIAFLCFCQ